MASYNCYCNIAGEFPIGTWGIISAALRSTTNVIVTEGGMVLSGPATGDLSITAYAPLEGEVLDCPGRAGVGFTWDQRIDCDPETGVYMTTYFIPRGRDKAYTEGNYTQKIEMIEVVDYNVFNASASSGPHTVYYNMNHRDGYEFSYDGRPISINSNSGKEPTEIDFLDDVLVKPNPGKSSLYLTSFTWEYTPPNIPIVSYSFLFSYIEN